MQIVDLQNSSGFTELDVAFLSIAFDSPSELAAARLQYGTQIPLLSDTNHEVSEAYGVLEWAIATGEPGHTFVLVDTEGKVAWIQDYGAEENGGRMYVPVDELVNEIANQLR